MLFAVILAVSIFSSSVRALVSILLMKFKEGLRPSFPRGPSGGCVWSSRLAPGLVEESGSETVKQPLGPVWLAVVGRAITLPSNKDSSDVEIGRESEFVTCNLLLSP